MTNKLIRNVIGEGGDLGPSGMYATDTRLGMPGTSHFRLISKESRNDSAPSGLALLSAGIAFCYMTQLSRYIESMKMDVHGVRLVQFNPYVVGARATAEPIDTHLFLNGDAAPETHFAAFNNCRAHLLSACSRPKLRLNPICASSITACQPRAQRRHPKMQLNVRFGGKADIAPASQNVR